MHIYSLSRLRKLQIKFHVFLKKEKKEKKRKKERKKEEKEGEKEQYYNAKRHSNNYHMFISRINAR